MSKTPISILQELVVQRKDGMPDYYIEHCNDLNGFAFKCTVKACCIKAVGYASTKQDAKQNSARKALEILGYNNNSFNAPQLPIAAVVDYSRKHATFVNYVGKLNELASTHGKPYPAYHDEPITSLNGIFLTTCSFLQYVSQGCGPKKKDAKQDAARKMLEKLRDKDISISTLEMQNLHLDKEKKVQTLTLEIKNNYDKLTTAVNNVNAVSNTILLIPDIKNKVSSLEEFGKELKQLGYKYTIETFQKDPYIMMMKICDTNAIVMGNGNSKDQALNDLYENVLLMFNYGFSLKLEF